MSTTRAIKDKDAIDYELALRAADALGGGTGTGGRRGLADADVFRSAAASREWSDVRDGLEGAIGRVLEFRDESELPREAIDHALETLRDALAVRRPDATRAMLAAVAEIVRARAAELAGGHA